jgi:AcrR family transcriptional regulator
VPRAGLTQTRVIEEAERIADEVGLSNLTLAAVATRLGVRQPSLYKHIAGTDGLQRGIAVHVVRVALDVMAGYDLRDDDAIDAIRALRAGLHGFVTLEAGGGFGLPVDIDRSFDRLVTGLATAFALWSEND